jgi:hypothetical protein
MNGQLENRQATETAKRLEFYLSEAESNELRSQKSPSDRMCLAALDACHAIRNIVSDIADDAAFALKVGSQLLKDGVTPQEVGFFFPGAKVEYSKDGKHKPCAIEFVGAQPYSEHPKRWFYPSPSEDWLDRDETVCPNNEYMQKLYWKGMLHKKIDTQDISDREHRELTEWLSLPIEQRQIQP